MHSNHFKIQVKGRGIKKNQITGLHIMLGILFLFMGLLSLVSSAAQTTLLNTPVFGWWMFILGGVLIFLSVFFNKKILQNKRLNYLLRTLEFIALLFLIVYGIRNSLPLQLTYISTAMLALIITTLWERNSEKNTTINMDDKGIVIRYFIIHKKIRWSEIQRVICKHGVLTIDCRNNRLYQYALANPVNDSDRNAIIYAANAIQANKHLYQEW